VRRVAQYFDRLDNGLRWALLLPVGLGGSIIFVGIIEAGFNAYWGNPRPFPGPIEASILTFFAALTRTLFPAIVSPRRLLVGIIMFALNFLLTTVPIMYGLFGHEYQRMRAREQLPVASLIIMVCIVGGVIGLYLIKRVTSSGATRR